jgi:hypothetical protein
VFDWAGTVVDHGSLAPMGVFVEAFAESGVAISDEARPGMGMAKRPPSRRWRSCRCGGSLGEKAWTRRPMPTSTPSTVFAKPKNRALQRGSRMSFRALPMWSQCCARVA